MATPSNTVERRELGVALHIRLTPNASRDHVGNAAVDATGQSRLKVYVRAVPEKGKANRTLIKLLSKKTGLAEWAMTVIAGARNRNKVILIEGEPADLSAKLENWLQERK